MASVTKTGTCLRPSCTAIVCPSISGMIVERRDQVLMTFFEFFSFWTSTFLSRWPSTNDQLVARLVLLAGTALRLTLRVHRVATTGGLTLTTTVRVVDRVHGHTT